MPPLDSTYEERIAHLQEIAWVLIGSTTFLKFGLWDSLKNNHVNWPLRPLWISVTYGGIFQIYILAHV
jgi:hypothetical protein